MDYQQNLTLIVVVLLLALAVYFVATMETTPLPQDDNKSSAELLLMKGLAFGKGLTGYGYAFTMVSDGYLTEYEIIKNGEMSLVKVVNLLSIKEAYFLANDTILCIEYPPGQKECASVQNNSKLENYMASLKANLFDDNRIDRNTADMAYLIEKGFVTLDGDIMDKEECSEVRYRLDYSNVTVSDASRFGIGVTSPKVFDFATCVDNETGLIMETAFNYSYEGMDHVKTTTVDSFTKVPGDIVVPENLTGDVVAKLEKEREQQVKLAECFTNKQGEDRNKCIATIALNLKRKDLCELAGERKDRCFVSLVPITKDAAICPQVTDPSFKDDCYIELAGAYKDESYCASVVDEEKKVFCSEVATREEPVKNDSGLSARDFLDVVEGSNSTSN